jgi:WD40 repeat protein
VFTLRGHNAPLIGVQFVQGTPQIVTADSDGCIKVWDARNFSCCQSFQSMSQISSFTACSQRHKRIFVVGKCHEIQIYEQEGGPFLRRPQEEPIFVSAYSPFTMTMLTANAQDVKVWDGITGNLSRVYRGLADTDLTAVCLDSRQRKLFVADQAGKIRAYNYLTGAYMKSLTPHNEEVIAMCYCGTVSMTQHAQERTHQKGSIRHIGVLCVCALALQRRLLISATDRTVYVHDERYAQWRSSLTAHPVLLPLAVFCVSDVPCVPSVCFLRAPSPIEEAVLYMTVTSGEGAEYLVVSVSDTLSTLACAMSNGKIDLWSLEQALRDVPISGGHPDVITALTFLDQQQLLLSADDSGNIMAWFVRPSRWKGQLAFQLHTPGKETTTSVIKHTRAPSMHNHDPIRLVNAASKSVDRQTGQTQGRLSNRSSC